MRWSLSHSRPGWHTIGLQAENPDPQPTIDRPPNEAQIYVVDPQPGLGIVSDVDDTVMVTALPSSDVGRLACVRLE